MDHYQPQGFSLLPPVVKNLLIINGLVYLASVVLYYNFGINANDYLGLFYFQSEHFQPYQVVTHFFAHSFIDSDGTLLFSHIFFNMFTLWMFGTAVENLWGPKRFLLYYILTAFGAAFLHTAVYFYEVHTLQTALNDYITNASLANFEYFTNHGVPAPYRPSFQSLVDGWNSSPKSVEYLRASLNLSQELLAVKIDDSSVVGASGAVYGILLAFGMMFPNALLYFFFFVPIKAKYAVVIFGLMALFSGFANAPGDNVAHFAHLGGMLFGFILIKYWQRNHFRYY